MAAAGCASLGAGAALGTAPLLATLAGSLALGLAYSADLPLLRWKRHPAVAATCILAVRAVLVQAGFYGHMRAALAAGGVAGGGVSAGGGTAGAPTISLTLASLPAPLIFATAMMLAFSVAIALLKDVPDVAGDAAAGVRTCQNVCRSASSGTGRALGSSSHLRYTAMDALCVVTRPGRSSRRRQRSHVARARVHVYGGQRDARTRLARVRP